MYGVDEALVGRKLALLMSNHLGLIMIYYARGRHKRALG